MKLSERANYTADKLPRSIYSKRTDYARLIPRKIYKDDEPAVVVAPKKAPVTRKRKAVKRVSKCQLALLIAAHNEEMVIEQTIRSAIKAGMDSKHIYVVDDNSTDDTTKIVRSVIGRKNTIKVDRSGKGLAITKASKAFKLVDRYKWIHIADADGGFATDYFKIFRKSLNPNFAAATGYVRSLPGGSVSQYRVVEYTFGMELHRRFQALTHTVTVIPGPTSCFRSDVFAKVNFANKSLTEDFDVTIQIHRQGLGRIQFIPRAVAYTQDPQNLRDFVKQITRWYRGVMQGVTRHRLGFRLSRVDAYMNYQICLNFMMLFNYFLLLPGVAYVRHTPGIVALAFLTDTLLLFSMTVAAAIKAGRKDIVSAFPQVYLYRWVTLYVFLRAFIEVVIFRKFRVTEGVWGTTGRRYKSAVSI